MKGLKPLGLVSSVGLLSLLALASPVALADVQSTFRSWDFVNLHLDFSNHFSWLVNPGFRYELVRTGEVPKKLYMVELFTGPVYDFKYKNIDVCLPLLYYYMGFPTSKGYFFSQNVDLRPSLKYKLNRKWILYAKLVFHNTFYSNKYPPADRYGYSLLLKSFFGVRYIINRSMIVMITEDPIFGVIENKNVKPKTGVGFSEPGLNMNRFFVGLSYKVSDDFRLIPQYCFELKFKGDDPSAKTLAEMEHYLFLTLQYKLSV